MMVGTNGTPTFSIGNLSIPSESLPSSNPRHQSATTASDTERSNSEDSVNTKPSLNQRWKSPSTTPAAAAAAALPLLYNSFMNQAAMMAAAAISASANATSPGGTATPGVQVSSPSASTPSLLLHPPSHPSQNALSLTTIHSAFDWQLCEQARAEDTKIREIDNPKVELLNKEVWRKFHDLTNEMIITKTGRRIFPRLEVRMSGLAPQCKYVLLLDIILVDEHRYKYTNRRWAVAGKGEMQPHNRVHIHVDSPATGEHWMAKHITFNKFKLTNAISDKECYTVLNSMHKYIPRFRLVRADDLRKVPYVNSSDFFFLETSFIAVTAYQNPDVTELKINNNPFAKGFRDSGNGRRQRKRFHNSQHQQVAAAFQHLPTVANEASNLSHKILKVARSNRSSMSLEEHPYWHRADSAAGGGAGESLVASGETAKATSSSGNSENTNPPPGVPPAAHLQAALAQMSMNFLSHHPSTPSFTPPWNAFVRPPSLQYPFHSALGRNSAGLEGDLLTTMMLMDRTRKTVPTSMPSSQQQQQTSPKSEDSTWPSLTELYAPSHPRHQPQSSAGRLPGPRFPVVPSFLPPLLQQETHSTTAGGGSPSVLSIRVPAISSSWSSRSSVSQQSQSQSSPLTSPTKVSPKWQPSLSTVDIRSSVANSTSDAHHNNNNNNSIQIKSTENVRSKQNQHHHFTIHGILSEEDEEEDDEGATEHTEVTTSTVQEAKDVADDSEKCL